MRLQRWIHGIVKTLVPDSESGEGRIMFRHAVRAGFWGLLFFALLGVCLGLGGYTFYYAQGHSYLSDDPRACVNCHIMRDQYDSWQKSPHHDVATCNDCHTPKGLIRKYWTKAENGYHHSRAFTLQDFHEPIRIRPKNHEVVQDNCLRCHQSFVGDIIEHRGVMADDVNCVRCHAGVGHGPIR
jgi:cytochrome c nitrite reductase small subunit